MIGLFRVVTRATALIAVTFGFFGIRLLQTPFTYFLPRADQRCRKRLFMCWARISAAILGMRITTEGPRPTPPYFLVTNHLTYLDGLALGSPLGAVFVAKSEVAKWPVVGFFAKQVNAIFVVREKRSDTVRVNDVIKQAMDNGDGVVMFAESTTSRGLDVLPFKTALFEVAARHQIPVHYAALHYSTAPGAPPASDWVVWWMEISFGRHLLGVLRGPGFNAKVTFGKEPIQGTDRKVLAEQLHDAVQAIFEPTE